MNQNENLARNDSAPADGEVSAIDLLIVLAKHKKSIIGAAFASAVVAAAASLMMADVYQSSTKLLPPQQTQSSAAALLSQLGGIAGAAAAGAAGMKNPSDLYIGMLKSRTVADRLIAQFDLKKVYGTKSTETARKALAGATTISSGKDGLILIEVEDRDKKRVAQLANAYVSELYQLMKTLAVTDAAQRRLFYERQLESTKDNLTKAEMALKSTMETHGVISVDAESRAILETSARLRAQVAAKEIQLNAMSAFVTPNNPEYRRAAEELNGLRAELAKLQNGRGSEAANPGSEGGLENIKLLRDLKYQQMLYEVLAKQYEVARIDEAKDPSVIQVLDPAVEPERKFKPKRTIITIVAALAAGFLAACWAFFSEWRNRVKSRPGSVEHARMMKLKAHLRWKKQ